MIDGGSSNIRSAIPRGRFGSDADQEQWAREAEAARQAMPKGRRFQVAPRMSVTTPAGVTLSAGAEVTASMFHGQPDKPAWALLESLVQCGRVLESDHT